MNRTVPTDGIRICILTTLMVGALLLAGCRAPQPHAFALVQNGMTQDEVLDLLGPPSSRWNAPPPAKDQPPLPWSVRWQYGDNMSTAASTALGSELAPDAVWVVAFNDKGKVISFRTPVESAPDYERQAPPK